MSDVTIIVNGVPRRVAGDVSLAVALFGLKVSAFRHDGSGAPRAPLCAIGVCFECRVSVDGQSNVRACLASVREGLIVEIGL